MDKNRLLSSTVLNRLAYGPTPGELERITAMTPQAYILEQLAPETIQETLDFRRPPPAASGWQYVSVTGIGLKFNPLYLSQRPGRWLHR